MDYVFPYYLFPRGSRIVICGAGEIGQAFYRQVRQDQYVEVMGILDKYFENINIEDISVESLEAIREKEYDYVLLTDDDASLADATKKELMKMGVSAKCILWDSAAYSREDFVKNIYFPMLDAWNSDYGPHEDFIQEFRRKMTGSDYDHVFPYHMFPKGAKVVIYGAGEVGKKFYRQALKDKYVNILGIVDKAAGMLQTAGLPVRHPKRLLEMEYDYVLVAIRNPKGMEEARETLLSYNVPASSIIWDGDVYLRGDFNKKTYLPMMEAWNAPRGEWQNFLAEYKRKMKGSIYDHVFPYHMFYNGARVVIYGAGDVANKFYLQGKKDGIVNIAGVVAENPDDPFTADVPVKPLESLSTLSYNFVLIAIRNAEAASAARKKLVELGVPADCIKWDGDVYLREDFNRHIYAPIVKAYQYPAVSHQDFVKDMLRRMTVPAAENLKVSVVVPVFNLGNIIRRCIGNLLSQTMQDFEVIFVDDASTDDTVKILSEMSRGNEKIRILQQEANGGAGAARNIGIQEAQGEYIIFLDGDDEYSPYLLEKASKALDETGADLVAFNFRRIYQDGTIEEKIGIHEEMLSEKNGIFNYTYCPQKIMSVVNPTPWNKMYRRSYLEKKQLKFEELSSTNDITFAAVSVAAAANIAYIKDSLYSYHVGHSGTITSSKAKNINNIVRAVESGYNQARLLPYYAGISESVSKFIVDNIIYGFDNYVKDWTAPESKEFYESVHQLFKDISTEELEAGEVLSIRNTQVFLMLRDVTYEDFMARGRHKMVVSMTSYPKRIGSVAKAVETLLHQSHPADEILLWLSEEEFLGEELPEEIRELERGGQIIIRWCENLKSHKKYFYALKEYTDAIVVTVDDDLYYPTDLLERLYFSYIRYPHAVSAARTHFIAIEHDGTVLPYDLWVKESNGVIGTPCMQLLATGGAGALYPPHCFSSDLFSEELIRELCLDADDLWLKLMEIHEGIPVVLAMPNRGLKFIEKTQSVALWKSNVTQNDVQLSKVVEWYDGKYGEGTFCEKLSSVVGLAQIGVGAFCKHLRSRMSSDKKRLIDAQKIVSKFGSFFMARIDISLKHADLSEFTLLDISDSRASVKTPKWAQNGKAGYCIESYQGDLKLRFRSLATSIVEIKLMGHDERNPRRPMERLERWIDYTNLTVNSKGILKSLTPAWHDKPYIYSFKAKEGDEIIIKAEWMPHIS